MNQTVAEPLGLISMWMRSDDTFWLFVKAAVIHYSADPHPSAHLTGPVLPGTPGSFLHDFIL